MTSSSSSVQEARKALGRRLGELRTEAGLTKRALAARLGWHESKCSRFENGTRPPSERDLREWTAACGVPGAAEDLITTARGIDGMYVEWRKMERTGLKQAQESVLPLVDPRPRADSLVHQRSAHLHPRPPWPHRRCADGLHAIYSRTVEPHVGVPDLGADNASSTRSSQLTQTHCLVGCCIAMLSEVGGARDGWVLRWEGWSCRGRRCFGTCFSNGI
jgi:transcriptional regulator with XRE-family HTH domain